LVIAITIAATVKTTIRACVQIQKGLMGPSSLEGATGPDGWTAEYRGA
jgi:hypothetical protein